MSLPSPITLNVGNPAADVVFERIGPVGGSILYRADSPQDDLEGQRTLAVGHTRNAKGLVRTNLKIKVPVYNSTTGTYTGHIQADVTIQRLTTAPVADCQDVAEMAEKALVQIKDELANAEV